MNDRQSVQPLDVKTFVMLPQLMGVKASYA